jgi:REP element-mobilizing transposase RayT
MKPFTINEDTQYYFCTDVIAGWQYVFTSHQYFDCIIDSFRYCQKEKGLFVHGFVVMPNHVHSILSARESNLSDILRDYKRFTSKKISSLLETDEKNKLIKYFVATARTDGKGNDYKIWQSGSHPIAINSQKFFRQKLDYIHQNPVRKGFVDCPEYWLYSSARNYILNDHSILKIDILE